MTAARIDFILQRNGIHVVAFGPERCAFRLIAVWPAKVTPLIVASEAQS
jgi:hypothetical protein